MKKTVLVAFFATFILSLLWFNVFKKGNSGVFWDDQTGRSGLQEILSPPVHDANPSYIEIMGGGVAVADYNGDGFDDIFFPIMDSFHPESSQKYSSILWSNNKDGTFTDVTKEMNLDSIKGYPMGAIFFDFDNNGTQDLFVAGYGGGQLYTNQQNTFVDITDQAGLNLQGKCGDLPCMTMTAVAADFDKNGYNDLLIINNVSWDIEDSFGYGLRALLPFAYQSQPIFLFKNNGDGTFEDVSEATGLTNKDVLNNGNDGKGLSAIWTDLNNDGWPDVYVANDVTPNRLYINNQNGSFSEIATSSGINEWKSSMGIDAADIDHNNTPDMITTNLEGVMVSLYKNQNGYRYIYMTPQLGLIPSALGSGWGVLFTDLNLDGHDDLAVANGALAEELTKKEENKNQFYLNDGDGFFSLYDPLSHGDNLNHGMSRGMAYLDVMNNGLADLIIANIDSAHPQLLVNKNPDQHHFLRINLTGTVSNRDAIGAKVTIKREDGLIQTKEVKAGHSYISSSSKSLFFGLGTSQIEQLSIKWPSGRTDVFDDIPVNEIITITEAQKAQIASEIATE
jgi:hypothetical protein